MHLGGCYDSCNCLWGKYSLVENLGTDENLESIAINIQLCLSREIQLCYWVIGLLLWLEPFKWFRIIDSKQDKHDEVSLQNTNMSDIK